ncbi:mRNA splicing protein [Rhinocladiella similis]
MSSKKPPSGPDQSRNEYIPSFISKRPFWAETTSDADYLEHQRLQSAPKDTLDTAKWYDRGRKAGPAATKFRKGACENCGAMTHKTKECLSRPRKTGARWTGRDIQADEVVEDVKLGWDAKRDRWNGYDPREYAAVVKEYEDLEALKKNAGTSNAATSPLDAGAEGEADDADAKYGEETDMGRSQPTSTRQLRLREDTANYLKNLDLDSARYDPKTRTMDTSAPELSNDGEVDVSDGFVRPATDDAAEFERAQRYAWETQESGGGSSTKKLHLQANPTEGEILRKKQTQESAEKKAAARKALLDKYGGDEYIKASQSKKMPQVVSSERYVEYDESGHIKGQERTVSRSKYPEDILTNNHTSVWGSWWHDFTWGYACCHSTVKNSYCTGEAGLLAFQEAEGRRTGETLMLKNGAEEEEEEEEEEEQQAQGQDDDGEEEIDTVAATTKKNSNEAKAKKRTLQELQSGISEEDLESYKRNRVAGDDPMASLLGKDELVEMK